MFENIMNFFKKFNKNQEKGNNNSREAAKERLHLVLMQDRANVSADFLELMKQEIIEVIKKYIDVDETAIDVKLTNQENGDGTNGAPVLYANIPIVHIKNETKKTENVKSTTITEKTKMEEEVSSKKEEKEEKEEDKIEEKAQEEQEEKQEVQEEEKQEDVSKQEEELQEKKEELKSED